MIAMAKAYPYLGSEDGENFILCSFNNFLRDCIPGLTVGTHEPLNVI